MRFQQEEPLPEIATLCQLCHNWIYSNMGGMWFDWLIVLRYGKKKYYCESCKTKIERYEQKNIIK